MTLEIESGTFSQAEWAAVLARMDRVSLLQTWEYAEAKVRTGQWVAERVVFVDRGEIVGAAQGLVRRLPLGLLGLMWVNRGPLTAMGGSVSDRDRSAMLRLLRQHWVERGGLYLRLAPPITAVESATIEPLAAGLQATGVAGWGSARLDLAPATDALRAGLDKKWRNCLSKAERLGVRAETSTDDTDVRRFVEAYRGVLTDRAFATSVTPELIMALQRLLPPERKLVVLRAIRERECIGEILLARYGDTAEYLAAHLGPQAREANAGHLLLWAAVCGMKAAGCRWLDVGGAHPERTPEGIYHFKMGLRAEPYEYAGEFDADNGSLLGRAVRWAAQRRQQRTEG